jgi:two-component system chemotaxis response regulator CheY
VSPAGDGAQAPETPTFTVLVVDDSGPIRQFVTIALADEGMAVVEAHDAMSALRFARAIAFDAVVLDEQMPGPSGTDVLPQLRELLPGARIVMFTSDDSIERKARALGADGFVAKGSPLTDVVRELAFGREGDQPPVGL